jgi:hypothetical protein
VLTAGLLWFFVSNLHASTLRRRTQRIRQHSQSIGLRNRVHVNRLITESGTVELEAGALFHAGGAFDLPMLWKHTPFGRSLLIGRTEYSLGFDAIPREDGQYTVAAQSLVLDGEHWNVSLGPNATFIRNTAGVRAGASLVVRYDRGLTTFGAAANWSKASSPSDNNPADWTTSGVGGGVRLGRSGWRSRITFHANATMETASSTVPVKSTFEGVEVEITSRAAVNIVAQQVDWRGPNRENQVLAGITVNFGRLRLRR